MEWILTVEHDGTLMEESKFLHYYSARSRFERITIEYSSPEKTFTILLKKGEKVILRYEYRSSKS